MIEQEDVWNTNTATSAASGAMTGAAIGAMGGPIGALGGAAIGAGMGIFTSMSAREDQEAAEKARDAALNEAYLKKAEVRKQAASLSASAKDLAPKVGTSNEGSGGNTSPSSQSTIGAGVSTSAGTF